MTTQRIWMPILAVALAFATVGVAGVMVYRMWRQAIAPVHIGAPAALRVLSTRRPS